MSSDRTMNVRIAVWATITTLAGYLLAAANFEGVVAESHRIARRVDTLDRLMAPTTTIAVGVALLVLPNLAWFALWLSRSHNAKAFGGVAAGIILTIVVGCLSVENGVRRFEALAHRPSHVSAHHHRHHATKQAISTHNAQSASAYQAPQAHASSSVSAPAARRPNTSASTPTSAKSSEVCGCGPGTATPVQPQSTDTPSASDQVDPSSQDQSQTQPQSGDDSQSESQTQSQAGDGSQSQSQTQSQGGQTQTQTQTQSGDGSQSQTQTETQTGDSTIVVGNGG